MGGVFRTLVPTSSRFLFRAKTGCTNIFAPVVPCKDRCAVATQLTGFGRTVLPLDCTLPLVHNAVHVINTHIYRFTTWFVECLIELCYNLSLRTNAFHLIVVKHKTTFNKLRQWNQHRPCQHTNTYNIWYQNLFKNPLQNTFWRSDFDLCF